MRRVTQAVIRLTKARGGLSALIHTMLAQGLTMGLNLATGIVTARLLGPEGRGEFAAASTWLLLPALLAIAGLQTAVVFGIRQHPSESGSAGLSGLILATVAFVPMLVVSLWLQPRLMHGYSDAIVSLSRMALLLSVLNVWMTMIRQIFLGMRQFGIFNFAFYGCTMVYLASLVAMMPFNAITPATATLSQIGATGVVLLIVLPFLPSDTLQPTRLRAHLRQISRFGVRACLVDLITALSQTIDRLVLVTMVPAAEFGIYVVALSFARILSIIQNAVSSVMLADLAASDPARVDEAIHRSFRVLLWALIPICAFLCSVDSKLLSLVYGSGFASASRLFRVLLADAALSCLTQVLIQGYISIGRPGVPSAIQTTSFCVMVTSLFLLTPMIGAVGAAIALALGSVVRLVLLLAALTRSDLSRPSLLLRIDDFIPLLSKLGLTSVLGGKKRPGLSP